MRTTILRRLGAMLAAAFLLPVLAAPAARAWTGATDVPGSQVTGASADLVVAPDAVVAWTRECASPAVSYRVRAAARTPGQPFAPLAGVRQSPHPIEHLHAAMSASGRATLAWKRDQDSGHLPQRLETAARGVSGNFGAPGEVPGATASVEGDFALAVSPQDTAIVASTDSTSAVAVRPSGSAFEPMRIVTYEAGSAPRVRFVDGERAIVGRKRLGTEYAATVAPDGTVGPTRVAGTGAAGQLHGLAGNGRGTVADWWVGEGGRMRLSLDVPGRRTGP